jgi:glutathione synthase
MGAYGTDVMKQGQVPVSTALDGLADGLAAIHNAYLKTSVCTTAIVLFVVQPTERNVFDQRHIEYSLFERHGVGSYRVTLTEVERVVSKDVKTGKIYLKSSGQEISTVYYRSAYAPTDYPTDTEWYARYFLEDSHAIKCPSVLTQLAGAKKVQQLLFDRSVAKMVAPELTDSDLSGLEKTYVGLYALENSVEKARSNPSRYVIKPQREGGGNNIYKQSIPEFLDNLPEEQLAAYILMELIEPNESENMILREGSIYSGNVVSELGIFGAVLWDTKTGESLLNSIPGWLLRTKLQSSDEGGVAAGFGCIDSLYLV